MNITSILRIIGIIFLGIAFVLFFRYHLKDWTVVVTSLIAGLAFAAAAIIRGRYISFRDMNDDEE